MPRPGRCSASTACEGVPLAEQLLWLRQISELLSVYFSQNLIYFLVIIEEKVTLKCFDLKK